MVARRKPAVPVLAGLVASSLAGPMLAKPVALEPVSGWNVVFRADACTLNREFGEEGNRHVLTFRQYWPSESAGLTLAGKSYGKFVHRQRTGVAFVPDGQTFKSTPLAGWVDGYGPAVIFPEIDIAKGSQSVPARDTEEAEPAFAQLDLVTAAAVRFVAVQQGGRMVRLETGPLTEAFKVMNECTASLARAWGLDPDRLQSARHGPHLLNQAAMVRRIQAAYPGSALVRGEQGVMRMRVIVSPEGQVESCTIVKGTNTASLDSPACGVMKAARFAPARDVAGEPIRSLFAATITYAID